MNISQVSFTIFPTIFRYICPLLKEECTQSSIISAFLDDPVSAPLRERVFSVFNLSLDSILKQGVLDQCRFFGPFFSSLDSNHEEPEKVGSTSICGAANIMYGPCMSRAFFNESDSKSEIDGLSDLFTPLTQQEITVLRQVLTAVDPTEDEYLRLVPDDSDPETYPSPIWIFNIILQDYFNATFEEDSISDFDAAAKEVLKTLYSFEADKKEQLATTPPATVSVKRTDKQADEKQPLKEGDSDKEMKDLPISPPMQGATGNQQNDTDGGLTMEDIVNIDVEAQGRSERSPTHTNNKGSGNNNNSSDGNTAFQQQVSNTKAKQTSRSGAHKHRSRSSRSRSRDSESNNSAGSNVPTNTAKVELDINQFAASLVQSALKSKENQPQQHTQPQPQMTQLQSQRVAPAGITLLDSQSTAFAENPEHTIALREYGKKIDALEEQQQALQKAITAGVENGTIKPTSCVVASAPSNESLATELKLQSIAVEQLDEKIKLISQYFTSLAGDLKSVQGELHTLKTQNSGFDKRLGECEKVLKQIANSQTSVVDEVRKDAEASLRLAGENVQKQCAEILKKTVADEVRSLVEARASLAEKSSDLVKKAEEICDKVSHIVENSLASAETTVMSSMRQWLVGTSQESGVESSSFDSEDGGQKQISKIKDGIEKALQQVRIDAEHFSLPKTCSKIFADCTAKISNEVKEEIAKSVVRDMFERSTEAVDVFKQLILSEIPTIVSASTAQVLDTLYSTGLPTNYGSQPQTPQSAALNSFNMTHGGVSQNTINGKADGDKRGKIAENSKYYTIKTTPNPDHSEILAIKATANKPLVLMPSLNDILDLKTRVGIVSDQTAKAATLLSEQQETLNKRLKELERTVGSGPKTCIKAVKDLETKINSIEESLSHTLDLSHATASVVAKINVEELQGLKDSINKGLGAISDMGVSPEAIEQVINAVTEKKLSSITRQCSQLMTALQAQLGEQGNKQ